MSITSANLNNSLLSKQNFLDTAPRKLSYWSNLLLLMISSQLMVPQSTSPMRQNMLVWYGILQATCPTSFAELLSTSVHWELFCQWAWLGVTVEVLLLHCGFTSCTACLSFFLDNHR